MPMTIRANQLRRPRRGVLCALFLLLAAGCSGGNAGSVVPGTGNGMTVRDASPTSQCGTVPDVAVKDPDGAVASLPATSQLNYSGYTGTVLTSRWANWKPASS